MWGTEKRIWSTQNLEKAPPKRRGEEREHILSFISFNLRSSSSSSSHRALIYHSHRQPYTLINQGQTTPHLCSALLCSAPVEEEDHRKKEKKTPQLVGCSEMAAAAAATKLVLVLVSNPPKYHPLSYDYYYSTFIPSSSHSYSYLSSSLPPFPNKPHFTTTRITRTTARVFSSLIDPLTSSSSSTPLFQLAETTTGYSSASYYTSLGLFVISVPGLWSLINRSVKSKIVQKTYISEDGEGKKTPNQVAGEILSFFTRNNFIVLDRGETITFEGMMVPSRGQAALLTFCTCISLASVSLVLTITNPDLGNNWFWLTIFSPLAGLYYWKRASRKEQIKVKMIVAEDGNLSEVIVQGDDVQIEKMRKELQLSEKGMVYVKGIFERS